MSDPIADDQDETTTLPSGKKAVLPPPPGTSSPMYNAGPDSKDDSPYTNDFLKRFDPAATKGLTDNLAGIERERGAALEKSSGEVNSRMARDKAQMEHAFGAESASANSIPPMWNADKERQDRISDPIANFGSIGSIFALVASAFTKTPMTSALNGAAAAMQAIHDHDEEGYKSAYQAWKDNTELALKRFGMERELFEDTNKLMDHDVTAWKVQTLAQAAQFDNKKVIAMLDAGMDDKIIEMQASQVQGFKGLIEVKEAFENFNAKHQMTKALFDIGEEQNPPPPKDATPDQQRQYYKEHPGALPQYKMLYRGYATQSVREGGKPNPVLDAKMQAAGKGKVLSAEEEAHLSARASSIMGGAEGALEEAAYRKHVAEGDDEETARRKAIAETVATKTKVPPLSSSENKELTTIPSLMKHLATLDAFSSATGTLSGVVQRLGAEYGGVNDPAIIWQTAKRQAEAAVAELASGGRVSVVGLKAQLEQLPDDYRAARFGKYQVQQFMRDLRDKAQTELDNIQSSGKSITPEVLDKFAAIGVYPASSADKDPLLQLRKDPTKIPDEALIDMSHYMSALPLEDQQKIMSEAKRRKALEGPQ